MDNQEKGFFEEFTEMAKKILKGVFKLFKLKTIIIIGAISVIIFILTVSTYITTRDEGLFDSTDKKNVPNNIKQHNQTLSADENGTLHRNSTIQELWDEMVSNGSNIQLYLSGPEELAKLVNAEVVTQNINTGDDINWDNFSDVNTTETVGIIELTRANADGELIDLKYLSPNEFYDNIDIYNNTELEDKVREAAYQKAMTHYTLDRPEDVEGSNVKIVNGEESHIVTDTMIIEAISENDTVELDEEIIYQSGEVKVVGDQEKYKVGDIIFIETSEEGEGSVWHQRCFRIAEVEHSLAEERLIMPTPDVFLDDPEYAEHYKTYVGAEIYTVLEEVTQLYYKDNFRFFVYKDEESGEYFWPAESEKINSYFGYRDDVEDDNGEVVDDAGHHTGIDIDGETGDPVYAIADGVVKESIALKANGVYISYGEYIVIEHTNDDGSKFTSLYAHGEADSRIVEVGDVVKKGDRIMNLGNTGKSTGSHLHFEIRNEEGVAIDPLDFIYNVGKIGLGNESVAVIASFKTTETTIEETIRGEKQETEYEYQREMITANVDYKEVTEGYTMPFDFLWALLVIGQEEKFVLELADLVLGSEIEIVINDTVKIDTIEEVTYKKEDVYVQKYNEEEENYKDEYAAGQTESKEIKTKVITTNTVQPNLTVANTWISNYLATYTYVNGEEEILNERRDWYGDNDITTGPYLGADGKPIEGWRLKYVVTSEVGEDGVEREQHYRDTIETQEKDTYIVVPGTIEMKIDPDADTPNFVNIYNKSDYAQVRGNIDTASEWLFQIISGNSSTSHMVDLLKFLLFQATGTNYGVEEFDINIFTKPSTLTGSSNSLLTEYLRTLEYASGAPTNEAGTHYIIYGDPKGFETVGYGIAIFKGGYESLFEAAGHPTHIGGEVPIDFVDALEEDTLDRNKEYIVSATAGLNLTEYQVNALVSRGYNMGRESAITMRFDGKTFIEAYNAYWNDSDDQFEERNNVANLEHQLYSTYLYRPITSGGEVFSGLIERRKSEWTLFQTGYYDMIDKWHSEIGDNSLILQIAEEYQNTLKQENWKYFNDVNELVYDNIKLATENPKKVTCCATFVSSVLYLSGYVPEGIINTMNYNLSSDMHNTYKNRYGWEEINDLELLEPGDIVFMNNVDNDGKPIDHVQIYAGNGTWYNAGKTDIIRGEQPYESNIEGRFVAALRPEPIN